MQEVRETEGIPDLRRGMRSRFATVEAITVHCSLQKYIVLVLNNACICLFNPNIWNLHPQSGVSLFLGFYKLNRTCLMCDDQYYGCI